MLVTKKTKQEDPDFGVLEPLRQVNDKVIRFSGIQKKCRNSKWTSYCFSGDQSDQGE